MISSACPLAYTSALSKKLTPASRAADSSALACSRHRPNQGAYACGSAPQPYVLIAPHAWLLSVRLQADYFMCAWQGSQTYVQTVIHVGGLHVGQL
jgi:hypothetical protein